VIVDGATVLPANTNAFLRVTDVKNPRLKRASPALSLIAVTINGQRVEVRTDQVAAIGAGAGAAIGAIAGAAFGAGIGAVAGGASGTRRGLLNGKTVEIAPDTRFTYKLTQPVAVYYREAGSHATAAAAAAPALVTPPSPDGPQASPTTVSLGQAKDQVVSSFGRPERTARIGPREVYFYNNLKLIFVSGELADAE